MILGLYTFLILYLITGVCAAAGLYGVYSHDRGWLMLSVIFQSSLVTTCGIYIGTLLRQRTLGASKADGQEWFLISFRPGSSKLAIVE